MTVPVDLREFEGQGEVLKPYVPRLLIEWVHDSPAIPYRQVEGSLAFVDISGFTALTERLARRGKVGAEILRDTLDGVFNALLDEAYLWGAGLIKWGGDALLLFFDGPGHEARAARAAWEMQRTIARVGRVRVGGDTVTLRMSIGIATGPIDFCTAGSVHRELLVVGSIATETAEIEALADAGEIGLSRTLARHLDQGCVGPPKDGALLLLVAPPEAEHRPAPDVGSVRGLDVASCIPIASRAHVMLERTEPEHRTITAAFIDLMETDVLLARLGPARFARAIDERISSIQEAALRYEIPFNLTDISKGSVKTLLTAGAPSSTGHDEEQMLRALREVMDEPGVVPMRVGVNTGRVFTGDFGPRYRRAYSVFGDAVNTAARVMARAEAGQILSTEVVLTRSRTTFATTPIEPFQVKGKAEPLEASIVGRIVGRRGERTAETPFIGRDAELAALISVIDEVRHGNGWIVEIGGAAGAGRSRLVQELVDRSPDLRVLHARCEEYEASTPYFALRAPMRAALGLDPQADADAAERRLREVVARIDEELVPWVPLLGILLGLDLAATPETSSLDERFLRDTLADVALRFLVDTLGGTATMLAVEDVQFMDEASADLLVRLSRAAGSLRYALVVTHSDPTTTWAPVGDEDLRCLAFTLRPLTDRQAAEIIQIATDERPLSPHVVEEIARRSGGNVLFLFELLDMARATGTTDALPDSVEAVIAADIDRLSPPDRMVLRSASVLGASFDRELLVAALAGEVELDDPLWQRLHGIVDPDATGRMRFRNTLVRDAAYEGLPFRRRSELHARVAQAIESAAASPEEEAPTLALHFFEAHRHAKAWHYGRVAGDRARAVAATVEAARFYQLALDAGRYVRGVTPRDRAEVLVALGAVRQSAGLFDQSFDAFRRATLLMADDPVGQARVFADRTRARVRTGPWTLALRETSTGLRLVEGREEPAAVAARAWLLALRSEIRMLQGRAREAISLALAAAAEAERVQELGALARAYAALDGSYQMLGEPEKAVHERMSIEIYTALGDIRARGIAEANLGVQAYADGKWAEAAALYLRAQEDCLQAGDRQHAAMTAANLGELLVSQGRYEEAEPVLRDARRVLRSAGFTPFAIFAEIQLARSALNRGDAPQALESLTRIGAEAASVDYAALVLEAGIYLAHAQAQAGAPEVGLDVLAVAVAAAGEDAALYAAAVDRARAACLVALDRLSEAREHLDDALESARAQGLLYEELLVRRARAPLCEPGAEAEEELREADRLAQLLDLA
jgi:class 3 adenylate cyclase/tetratricopeptide (TPR) repeat protein